MIERYLRQSPLAHLGLGGHSDGDETPAQVSLAEREFFGLVNLRGPSADQAFLAAFEAAAGYALPNQAGASSSGTSNTSALWLGPQEWAILDPRNDPEAGPRIAESLREALAGFPAAVTDISEARACISVSGIKARATVQKACPLDLHPSVFRAGHCAQTRFAKVAGLIHLSADDAAPLGPSLDIYIARSFAEYLWLWLADAAHEYTAAPA